MAVIGNLAVMISANSDQFRQELRDLPKGVKSFANAMSGTLGKVAALTGGLFAVGGAFSAMSSGIKGAADMEQAEISFGVLLGSTEDARRALQDLSKFAAETPFELPELTSAGRSLVAFGVTADELTPTLRRIGDVASGIVQPIGEIAEIYGKARVQGRLFMEDINQLTGRGIPIIGELANQFGVAESEVRGLVSTGRVSFQNLETAFKSMTAEGVKFGGMMEKQSQSLTGLWSTLSDTINATLRDISAELLKTFNVKAMISGLTVAIGSIGTTLLTVLKTLVAITPVLAGVAASAVTLAVGLNAAAIAQVLFTARAAAMVIALKAIAIAQSIVLALSGPKGWAILAASAAIGVAAYVAIDRQMGKVVVQAQAATAEVKANGNALAVNAQKAMQAEAAQKKLAAGLKTAKDRFLDLRDEIQVLAAPEAMKPFVEINQELLKLKAAGAPMQAIAGVRALLLERQRLLELQKQESAEEDRIKKAMEDEANLAERLADEEESRVKGLQDRAAQLMEEMKTPFDKLQDKLAEIQNLFAEGIIDKAQMDKLSQFTQQQFEEGQDGAKPGDLGEVAAVGAVQRGSSEAFSSVFSAMRNGSGGNGMQALAKSSEKNAENSSKIANSTKATASTVAKLEAKMPTFVAGKV